MIYKEIKTEVFMCAEFLWVSYVGFYGFMVIGR